MTTPKNKTTDTTGTALDVPAEKPLGATQIRTLEKLVTNDFNLLRQQVAQAISVQRDSKIDDHEKEFAAADKKLTKAVADITKMTRDFEDKVTDKLAKLKEDGIGDGGGRSVVKVNLYTHNLCVTSREEAKQEIIDRSHRVQRAANMSIDRQESAMRRNILLQGIGVGAARDIVEKFPDSQTILSLVEAEIGQSDDFKMLSS